MGCCGKVDTSRGRARRDESADDRRKYVDPTRAAFAASRVQYVVLANSAARSGKRFSTMQAAQDYARQTGGIIRPV
jgi:hypothetical protein